MNMKRILSLLLCVVMLLSIFASCGVETPAGPGEPTQPTEPTLQETQPTEKPDTEIEEPTNPGQVTLPSAEERSNSLRQKNG